MHRHLAKLVLCVSSSMFGFGGNPASAQSLNYPTVATRIIDYSSILDAAKWQWGPNSDKIINVCWENPSPDYKNQMELVRKSVADTWQAHSRLKFLGWQKCPPIVSRNTNVGQIRILIDDQGPHTKGLGTQIRNVRDGMVLNFTFSNWSPACAAPAMYALCVSSIAVHEFGHALGFAHEQNRPDTPGECAMRQAPQGTSGDTHLTPWDPISVMNYCNVSYNNGGALSALDIRGLQKIYGAP